MNRTTNARYKFKSGEAYLKRNANGIETIKDRNNEMVFNFVGENDLDNEYFDRAIDIEDISSFESV